MLLDRIAVGAAGCRSPCWRSTGSATASTARWRAFATTNGRAMASTSITCWMSLCILFVFAGLVLGGHMSPRVGGGFLLAYYLLMIEIALATHAVGSFRISFWKFGPTELRILLAAGIAPADALRLRRRSPGTNYRLFDIGGPVASRRSWSHLSCPRAATRGRFIAQNRCRPERHYAVDCASTTSARVAVEVNVRYDRPMILAAVDDLLFSSKIRTTAKQAGVELVFARTPAEILEQTRTLRPALVIFDLNSAKTNPIETIAALKRIPNCRPSPRLASSHTSTPI